MKHNQISSLIDFFKPIYGKPCWQVQKGYGSFITFEFGNPHLDIEKVLTLPRRVGLSRVKKNLKTRSVRPRGEWHLWIYCCYWKLKLVDVSLTHSESSDRKIEKALSILNGQELVSVNINRETKETEFEFDLGGILSTTPYEYPNSDGEPYESWMLYLPDGNVVTYRADGKYAHESGQEASDELEWIED